MISDRKPTIFPIDQRDRYVVELVLSSAKPGGMVWITEPLDESRLLAVPTIGFDTDTHVLKDRMFFVISLRGKLVSDAISPEQIEQYRGFGFHPNMERLYNDLKGMEIASALDHLLRLSFNEKNGERMRDPEIDALLGILFGYNACCVKYFLETRHLKKSAHELESEASYYEVPHTLCRDCAEKLLAAAGKA